MERDRIVSSGSTKFNTPKRIKRKRRHKIYQELEESIKKSSKNAFSLFSLTPRNEEIEPIKKLKVSRQQEICSSMAIIKNLQHKFLKKDSHVTIVGHKDKDSMRSDRDSVDTGNLSESSRSSKLLKKRFRRINSGRRRLISTKGKKGELNDDNFDDDKVLKELTSKSRNKAPIPQFSLRNSRIKAAVSRTLDLGSLNLYKNLKKKFENFDKILIEEIFFEKNEKLTNFEKLKMKTEQIFGSSLDVKDLEIIRGFKSLFYKFEWVKGKEDYEMQVSPILEVNGRILRNNDDLNHIGKDGVIASRLKKFEKILKKRKLNNIDFSDLELCQLPSKPEGSYKDKLKDFFSAPKSKYMNLFSLNSSTGSLKTHLCDFSEKSIIEKLKLKEETLRSNSKDTLSKSGSKRSSSNPILKDKMRNTPKIKTFKTSNKILKKILMNIRQTFLSKKVSKIMYEELLDNIVKKNFTLILSRNEIQICLFKILELCDGWLQFSRFEGHEICSINHFIPFHSVLEKFNYG